MGIFKTKKAEETGSTRLPRHIAIILDGNGRWAKKRGLPRTAGHAAGAETFRRIATYCKNIGIEYLTVYAFSTENWKRPREEIDAIMNLLGKYLRESVETMERDHIKLKILGDPAVLSPELLLNKGKRQLPGRRSEMAVLECAGLSKSYGAVKALEDIDLKVEPGRVVGLLGPNGSGKTTLIKLANGLLQPSAGRILVCGCEPGPETKAEVSYMPERLEMPEWTRVRRLADFFADFYADFDRERAAALLTRLGIDGESRLRQLSKGLRQKVQLSLVMSRRAKLYLLDEPFGGMDPASRDLMLETVLQSRAPEAAVVISTHIITDVERVLDDVVFLDRGGVRLCSPAAELRAREGKSVDELFREVFRC